jgi:hypothetical protein
MLIAEWNTWGIQISIQQSAMSIQRGPSLAGRASRVASEAEDSSNPPRPRRHDILRLLARMADPGEHIANGDFGERG